MKSAAISEVYGLPLNAGQGVPVSPRAEVHLLLGNKGKVGPRLAALWTACFIVALLAVAAPAAEVGRGEAKHVVMVVWDGMRPDLITPQYTPTLYALARGGTFFKNHHPVFPSTTEVNGTALATGVYPNRNGIAANNDYRPELSFLGGLPTEGLDNIRRADMLTGGRYLLAPTLAEILQGAGFPTVIAGTKPVVLLHDRAPRSDSTVPTESVVLFAGQTLPKSVLKKAEKANDNKKFPATNSTPNTEKDSWTTKALLGELWKPKVPAFTLLWLYEPDSTQHGEGVGSDLAMAGVASSDKNLEEVLKTLEEKKLRDRKSTRLNSSH